MERMWNDPERGKRGIPERKPVLFCVIYKGSVRYITQNTDFHQKEHTEDVACGKNRCFCENYTEYTKYTTCR